MRKNLVKILIGVFLVMQMSMVCFAKQSTAVVTSDYYDSLIKSWKTGYYKSTVLWSYNSGKLDNKKDINLSYKTPFGYTTTSESSKWSWYDTSVGGDGYAKSMWSIMIGVDTKWVSIGIDNQKAWHAVTVYPDGGYDTHHSYD